MDDGKSYQERRQKNNEAVKKSREKSRQESKLMLENVKALQAENDLLQNKILSVEQDNKAMAAILCRKEVAGSPALKSEEKNIKEVIPKRRSFLLDNVHYAANLLDPKYKGCHLQATEVGDATEAIYNAAINDPMLDEDQVIVELAHYKAQEGQYSKKFYWSTNILRKMNPKTWWTGVAPLNQLSKIAAKIVSLPPTSASVERSFSLHSWIHSKKRNRLTADRAAKLVFINHNHRVQLQQSSSVLKFSKKQNVSHGSVSAGPVPSTSHKNVEKDNPTTYKRKDERHDELDLDDSDSDIITDISNEFISDPSDLESDGSI